jgi:hypothetical protein
MNRGCLFDGIDIHYRFHYIIQHHSYFTQKNKLESSIAENLTKPIYEHT